LVFLSVHSEHPILTYNLHVKVLGKLYKTRPNDLDVDCIGIKLASGVIQKPECLAEASKLCVIVLGMWTPDIDVL